MTDPTIPAGAGDAPADPMLDLRRVRQFVTLGETLNFRRFLVFTLRANAFLHHMVRNLIGALLQVGQGREPVAWMDALLCARDRRLGAPTFMPDGLYLSAIEYPAEFGFDELDGGITLLSPFTGALG